ncbi:patatin-like phospholipase family protein [Maridesulfovibrio sp.]|uniref:patatin-like phospholipase family protein n=1 Tax=Maridesulfovibrio sp. TaxID=2795000 RepID=UPI0039EE12A3
MEERTPDKEYGLGLSGGGFRATLFNLGSLWRLNELGYLKKLDIITSVSGGSITSGVLATRWNELIFQNGVAINFEQKVADTIQDFCKRDIDVSAGLSGIINIFDSISDEIVKRYDKHLFNGATLQDLPNESLPKDDPDYAPRFQFYATSLQTGSSVRMCRKRLADYKIGEIPNPEISLATAVAASSAFPPVLSPLKVNVKPKDWKKWDGAYLYDEPGFRSKLYLTDGGVYDNMGLESIWKRCKNVLVSDAGAPLDFDPKPSREWAQQSVRVLNIITDQARAVRKTKLIEDYKRGVTGGAYWGIRTKISSYGTTPTLVKDGKATQKLANIRTRLNHFSSTEQKKLINWGYALTDTAMRTFVERGADMGSLPYPKFPIK